MLVTDPTPTDPLPVRSVRLRVQNISWMADYHGREANLVGEVVDALEVIGKDAVAYVDDRDGEATELWAALSAAQQAYKLKPNAAVRRSVDRFRREFRTHAARRFLDGQVMGVRV